MQLEKVYEPQRFEPRWADEWFRTGVYRTPEAGRVFSLAIPPPNVTGSLHMGHMLEHTEIDVTIRWHRMRGDRTLWLPGTDHAGIATQMVVERDLAKQGIQRKDLGREAFEAKVWEWKKLYGDRIKLQMIQVGTSCDWSRERFTFDPGLSRAVREVFVRLYEKGLLYRGAYMVNWCPRCQTALSDLEVEHEEKQGHLWHIRYPVNGTDRFVVVATTRPETMLGDTAVAVNASDERYRDIHGKTVRLPLMDRDIPVILDDVADPKFGTGVVKVTPAHDPNDLEAGKRHDLPKIQVIDNTGHMTAAAGEFAGLDRFEARRRVVDALKAAGLLEKIEDHTLSVGVCQRCTTIVEPLISTQWFLSMKSLAEPAIAAVETGRVEFIPETWTATYFQWMRNIRDWCVSRQLWWGHRIPAWHCGDCRGITVARETPEKCSACGSAKIEQDTDVLDTWFSSQLWPFSTLGWPDDTEDLRTFYPTSLLIVGYEILFFWVARMIMMGLEFMGDVPFRQVHIHGIVRDAEKKKMSKTRGNTVDPLDITAKYGTDAVRMALITAAAPGSDVIWTEDRLPAARAFANKIWNAARFLFMKMESSGVAPCLPDPKAPMRPEAAEGTVEAPIEDRWIFSRLNHCADAVNRNIDQYRYHEVAQTLYHFFWHEFCDWYLELKKLRFQDGSGLNADWRNALKVFEAALRLLHPAMPFLTEELWHRLGEGIEKPASIGLAPYPEYDASLADHEAEREMSLLMEIITAARALRSEMKMDPKVQLEGVVYSAGTAAGVAERNVDAIRKLASVDVTVKREAPPLKGCRLSTPEFDLLLEVPEAQLDALRARLRKEIEQLEKNIANLRRQLTDETFLGRAPAHVVDGLRAKLADYEAQVGKTRSSLEALA